MITLEKDEEALKRNERSLRRGFHKMLICHLHCDVLPLWFEVSLKPSQMSSTILDRISKSRTVSWQTLWLHIVNENVPDKLERDVKGRSEK